MLYMLNWNAVSVSNSEPLIGVYICLYALVEYLNFQVEAPGAERHPER
jgi:hypothetical protein